MTKSSPLELHWHVKRVRLPRHSTTKRPDKCSNSADRCLQNFEPHKAIQSKPHHCANASTYWGDGERSTKLVFFITPCVWITRNFDEMNFFQSQNLNWWGFDWMALCGLKFCKHGLAECEHLSVHFIVECLCNQTLCQCNFSGDDLFVNCNYILRSFRRDKANIFQGTIWYCLLYLIEIILFMFHKTLSTVQTVGYGTQFVAKTSFIRWWEESSFTSSKTRKKRTLL